MAPILRVLGVIAEKRLPLPACNRLYGDNSGRLVPLLPQSGREQDH
jgi:hypothetical protein